MTRRLSNTSAFSAATIQTQLTGQQELIVYQVTDPNESPTPTTCQPFSSLGGTGATPILFSRHNETITLPAGFGVPFAAQQMLRLELHGLNGAPMATDFDALVTFTPASGTTAPAKMLMELVPDINVPSGMMGTVTGTVLLPADLTGGQLLNYTGFTRSRGVLVEGRVNGATVYSPSNYQWNAPDLFTPTPSTAIGVDGGVRLDCMYNNTSGQPAGFGESFSDEICLMRTWTTPASNAHICVRSGQFGVDLCCPGNALCSQLF